ncbi:MAG: amidohydrolase family protein [Phycisphaerae bacterium]
MIIDVHCHVGLSARRVDPAIPRFSFEADGASGRPGYDGYLSPRLLGRRTWWLVRRWLGVSTRLPPGDALDAAIQACGERHWSEMPGVDRLVLLAFDEYHDDDGRVIGAAERGQRFGSDLYVSNSFVRAMCRDRPDRFLFGASIHPYRMHDGRDAATLLHEVVEAGCALVKWLPIHQNIRIDDPRSVAFLRSAARAGVAMLIHYGGEMSLARQHMDYESPVALLEVLRRLRSDGAMPTVIVAHAATPSFPWQSAAGHHALIEALLGEFADAPLYADISALAAFGRTVWLRRLAKNRPVHRKLVWGSDFPIPVLLWPFRRSLGCRRRELRSIASWVERDLRLKQALGFDPCVFTQAAEILRVT